jgi:hypothetical protein
MADGKRLNWIRIVAAVLAAEALPILALVAVVFVYGFIRKPDSLPPDKFAPLAGNWVGPIGGFLATAGFAYWAAKPSGRSGLASGIAVGIGTALLDFGLAYALVGKAAFAVLLVVSNCGRLIAGTLGGWLAAWQRPQTSEAVRQERS